VLFGLAALVWVLLLPGQRQKIDSLERDDVQTLLASPDSRVRAVAAEAAGHRQGAQRYARALVDLLPRLGDVRVMRQWAGAYDVTPDSYPILDRVGPNGLFVAVGFSGHGFKLSPEVGRLVAEYVATDRRPELLQSLRASRFREGAPIRPDAPFPRRGRRLP